MASIAEVGRGLAVAVAYVRKDGRQFIGWTDACDCYREETSNAAGRPHLPVFALDKSADDRLFLLTNPAGYSLTYNGLVLAAEKRRANGWQASGSYTYSRASGLQASSGATAAGSQVSTVAGVPILTFGRDPNDLTNARGLLPNDRPHMLRVMGSLDVPGTGWAVAASAQHVTGKPWSSSAQVKLPQGEMRILLEPRGARRLSSQTLVDLRVSRSFSLGSAAPRRAAHRRPECAERDGGRRTGDRRRIQPEVRSADAVRRSPPRHAGSEAEPGALTSPPSTAASG